MPVFRCDMYKYLRDAKGEDVAFIYRKTVNMLRRSYRHRGGKGKYELTLLIEEIGVLTARIFDLEKRAITVASDAPNMEFEKLLLTLKSARRDSIVKLDTLIKGKDVFKALQGKQGYRNSMVRSKIMKQEMDIEQINENKSEGVDPDETPVGESPGSDV